MRRYNNADTLERKSVDRRMVVAAAGGRGCWYIQAICKGWFDCLVFTIFVCLFAEEPLSWRSVA